MERTVSSEYLKQIIDLVIYAQTVTEEDLLTQLTETEHLDDIILYIIEKTNPNFLEKYRLLLMSKINKTAEAIAENKRQQEMACEESYEETRRRMMRKR